MRFRVGVLLTALVLAGCSAGSTSSLSSSPTSSSPSPTSGGSAAPSEPATADQWTLVSISDSTFGTGDNLNVAAIDAYAASMARELGVRVTVRPWWYGGASSDQILYAIQSDHALRKDIQDADVIVFRVPIGEFTSTCPWDPMTWAPASGTSAEWQACTAKVVANFTANARSIVEGIVALRSPSEAIIRTTNLWEFGVAGNVSMGIEPVMRPMFMSLNAALSKAASANGIPVADAFAAFMGPDGKTDPVAIGDVADDGIHLTAQGAARLGELLQDLGYARAGSD